MLTRTVRYAAAPSGLCNTIRDLSAGPPQSTPEAFGSAAARFWMPRNSEGDRTQRRTQMYLNQPTNIGFTGGDAEGHYTTSGTPVTRLSVSDEEILEERRRRVAEPHRMAWWFCSAGSPSTAARLPAVLT